MTVIHFPVLPSLHIFTIQIVHSTEIPSLAKHNAITPSYADFRTYFIFSYFGNGILSTPPNHPTCFSASDRGQNAQPSTVPRPVTRKALISNPTVATALLNIQIPHSVYGVARSGRPGPRDCAESTNGRICFSYCSSAFGRSCSCEIKLPARTYAPTRAMVVPSPLMGDGQ